MGESGQNTGGALLVKDRSAPIGKGRFLAEKGVSHGSVSPHLLGWTRTRITPHPSGRACLGLTKGLLEVSAA